MTHTAEIRELRRYLNGLAKVADAHLIRTHELRVPPIGRLGLYRRTRMLVGKVLRWLGLRKSRPLEPWLPVLKHMSISGSARPVVLWAIGVDRDLLRRACTGFKEIEGKLAGNVFILITDVSDFAWFSRLGWLVEYVPQMAPPADQYASRKKRYLAWRYKGMPAVPASLGLKPGLCVQDLQLD